MTVEATSSSSMAGKLVNANSNGNGNNTTNNTNNGTQLLSSSSPSSSSSTPAASTMSSYFGFDKKEVTRLLIQSLHDLGYHDVGKNLETTSGFSIESPEVLDLRTAILSGNWDEAEKVLLAGSILLQKQADITIMKFLIRRQRYLEILERDDRQQALSFLRTQLSSLNCNKDELHYLSKLAMFSLDDIKADAHWDGANGQSRQLLLESLQEFLSPSIMIPPHRLATLLNQAKMSQLIKSDYWLGNDQFSLYKDFPGDRGRFPNVTSHILMDHYDEVWYLDFSHDGKYLASSSADKKLFIWNVENNFELHRKLVGHDKGVVFFSWSPNDKYILSCGQDSQAILWDTSSGQPLTTICEHKDAVNCCAWLSDSNTFVTGSPDKRMVMWNLAGEVLHKWTEIRALNMAITPDGEKMIVLCSESIIHVFDLPSRKLITEITIGKTLTSISISRDSRYALVNVVPEEVHLWDLEKYRIQRIYVGQLQEEFIIRSCFGGLNENFVLSGSQDSHIYIWNRDTGSLIEALPGHNGTVNCVQWRPGDPGMFASAGDDGTIRIWQPSKRD